MSLIHWPDIVSFHNIRKYAHAHPGILNGQSKVQYRLKCKMHGTQAAIQCHADGRVICQSRTVELINGADNNGFAAWVKTNEDHWKIIDSNSLRSDLVIFGEWCGNSVQHGVALSQLPNKIFVVFGARSISVPETFISDPITLSMLVKGIPDTYVLPWHTEIEIDWTSSPEELSSKIEVINKWVSEIEANDPWVEKIFGIKGIGEGIVFYPSTTSHLGWTAFSNLVFKAKGEKHKNIKYSSPAQIDPEVAASIEAFADMVLTVARLEQGTQATSSDGSLSFDTKNLGKFIGWISKDVLKETKDELEASKLEWKQVQRMVENKARTWFIGRIKKSE